MGHAEWRGGECYLGSYKLPSWLESVVLERLRLQCSFSSGLISPTLSLGGKRLVLAACEHHHLVKHLPLLDTPTGATSGLHIPRCSRPLTKTLTTIVPENDDDILQDRLDQSASEDEVEVEL